MTIEELKNDSEIMMIRKCLVIGGVLSLFIMLPISLWHYNYVMIPRFESMEETLLHGVDLTTEHAIKIIKEYDELKGSQSTIS